MSSIGWPDFSYEPLVEPNAIRLVHLYPAYDVTAQLECSIEHTALSKCDEDLVDHCTALSYVWGDPTHVRPITVDGFAFKITANLDSALRHLRDRNRVVRVWADAIAANRGTLNYPAELHTRIWISVLSMPMITWLHGISTSYQQTSTSLPCVLLVSEMFSGGFSGSCYSCGPDPNTDGSTLQCTCPQASLRPNYNAMVDMSKLACADVLLQGRGVWANIAHETVKTCLLRTTAVIRFVSTTMVPKL